MICIEVSKDYIKTTEIPSLVSHFIPIPFGESENPVSLNKFMDDLSILLEKVAPHILNSDTLNIDFLKDFKNCDYPKFLPQYKNLIQIPSKNKEFIPSKNKEFIQIPSKNKDLIQIPSKNKEFIPSKDIELFFKQLAEKLSGNPTTLTQIVFKELNSNNHYQKLFYQQIKNITFNEPISCPEADPKAIINLIQNNQFKKSILLSAEIDNNNLESMLEIIKNDNVEKKLSIKLQFSAEIDNNNLKSILEIIKNDNVEKKLSIKLQSYRDMGVIMAIVKSYFVTDTITISSDNKKILEQQTFFDERHQENNQFKTLLLNDDISGLLKFYNNNPYRQGDFVKYLDNNWKNYNLISKFNDTSKENQDSFLKLFSDEAIKDLFPLRLFPNPETALKEHFPHGCTNIKTLFGIIKDDTIKAQDLLDATLPGKDFTPIDNLIKKSQEFTTYFLKHMFDKVWSIFEKCQNYLKNKCLEDIFKEALLKTMIPKILVQHCTENEKNVSIHKRIEEGLRTHVMGTINNIKSLLDDLDKNYQNINSELPKNLQEKLLIQNKIIMKLSQEQNLKQKDNDQIDSSSSQHYNIAQNPEQQQICYDLDGNKCLTQQVMQIEIIGENLGGVV